MAQRRYGTESTINGPFHHFSKMYHGWYFLPFRGNLQGRMTSNRNQSRCVSDYYPCSRVPPTIACPSHNVSTHVRHAGDYFQWPWRYCGAESCLKQQFPTPRLYYNGLPEDKDLSLYRFLRISRRQGFVITMY